MSDTSSFDPAKLRQYLESVHGAPVNGLRTHPLGEPGGEEAAEKAYGYGRPVLIEYRVSDQPNRAVLHTMAPGPFGHEGMADRAAIWLWSHRAFNRLPQHVPSIDVGAFDGDGSLVSLGDAEEFFLLTVFAEGEVYAEDLHRLRGDDLRDADRQRCDTLCDYLLEVHAERGPDPQLYVRRIRELVGHGECIMGLTDNYPPDHPTIPPARLAAIERSAVNWRWALKRRTYRLRRVHGDLHPWNILFNDRNELHVLDRSRGEFGDPADDVVSLTMNYLFEAMLAHGEPTGPLRALFDRFWSRYLDGSGDEELLEVAAPFIAFRGLVLASPVWYPRLDESLRDRLVKMVERVLAAERFEPGHVDEYLDAR